LSAQQNLSGLCRRLLALLALAVAATLVVAPPGAAGASGLENASAPDRAPLTRLDGLIEDEERRSPDGTAGGAPGKAWRPVAPPIAALQPPEPACEPVDASGAPRTHFARAGLTRAPPRA
jgi:hypothetical protein